MEASDIIDVIKRRQAKFRERCKFRSASHMNEAQVADLQIAEEYDSLIAEIGALSDAKSNQPAPIQGKGGGRPKGQAGAENKPEQARAAAVGESQISDPDELILGDQGQSGG